MESGDTWASAPGLYDTAGAFYPITMAEELTTPQFSSGPQFSGPQFLTVPQYAHLPITLYLPPQFSPLLTHAESESYDQTDQMPSLTPFGSPLESLSPELQYDIMGLESINTSTAPRGELIPTEALDGGDDMEEHSDISFAATIESVASNGLPKTPTKRNGKGRAVPKPLRFTSAGKIHASSRRISADLDEADQLILRLKTRGESNIVVAEKLKELGISYDPKTIGTRYMRLQKAVETNKVMTHGREWTSQLDDMLLEAHHTAQLQAMEQIGRIKQKIFAHVATHMTKTTRNKIPFSSESCQRRFAQISELAGDDAAPVLSFTELQKAQRRRQMVEQANEIEKDLLQAEAFAEQEHAKAQKAREKRAKIAKELEEAEAAERAAIKKADIAAKKKIAVGDLLGSRAKSTAKVPTASKQLPAKSTFTFKVPSAPKTTPTAKAQSISKSKSTTKSKESYSLPKPRATPTSAVLSKEPTSPSPFIATKDRRKNVGVDLNDSRRHCTVHELEMICLKRGLSRRGPKSAMMKRIKEKDQESTIPELIQRLSSEYPGAPTNGTHLQLVERIAFLDADNSAWGKRFKSVTEDEVGSFTPSRHFMSRQTSVAAQDSFEVAPVPPSSPATSSPRKGKRLRLEISTEQAEEYEAEQELNYDDFIFTDRLFDKSDEDEPSTKRPCLNNVSNQDGLITPINDHFIF